ncbi:MAG: DUF4837 family protein [Bacteroidales bacterium]|nr:DUF4837 family protein [Bacteroidales bacterium]
MKKIVSYLILLCTLAAAFSCGSSDRKVLLPNVSGKAGEVLVIMDKDNWEGNLGNAARELLTRDCPGLPNKEPMYSLVNVAPAAFGDLFKIHRNIVFFNINPQGRQEGIIYRNDVWAKPQCLIQVNATTAESATELLLKEGETVIADLEQAERNRVIANTLLYENKTLAPIVSEMVGGKVHFPNGYRLKMQTDDFLWFADDKQYTYQDILVYKYPALPKDNFTVENIVAKRNEILKANVPGMFDNTYMTTSDYISPQVKFLKYNGIEFVETRGLWEVYGDYMGGPFVSHSFFSKDGKDIIVLDAFVYSPRFDKRLYMRQVESLLYSFEWDEK